MKLYIGNLSREVTDSQLHDVAIPFGKPESVKIIKDHVSGESRGFAFIEFLSEDEARAAIAGMNGQELHGLAIRVNEARPPKGTTLAASAQH